MSKNKYIRTSGTVKVFNEIKDLPCPHISDSANETCAITQEKCEINCPENCPVIEVLLEYVPWKREDINEYDEYIENWSEEDLY